MFSNTKLQELKYEILSGMQRIVNTAFLHQKTFSEYKNKYQGKTIVLVGAGPTLNYFNKIDNAIYVGANRTFLFDKIDFDYLFAIDKAGLQTPSASYYQQFFDYKGNNCIKFVGDQNLGIDFQIPESKIIGSNIKRYKTTSNLMPSKFTLDIDSEALGNFCSVSLQAIQFILYTNPAKIYLVGMDSNIGIAGHFQGSMNKAENRGENAKEQIFQMVSFWRSLKQFKNTYYPDTEIISINPVGLRGIFKDEYTEAYLNSEVKIKYEKDFEELTSSYYKDYLEDCNFDKTFKDIVIKTKNKKVLIYGAGIFFEFIHKNYDLSALNIIGISDKKFTSQQEKTFGYNEIAPYNISQYKPDYIIVATKEYDNIIGTLKNTIDNKKIPIIPLVPKKERK